MEQEAITLSQLRQTTARTAAVTDDLQTQIDNINGIPVVQIIKEDGSVLYMKETNVDVKHLIVSNTTPTGRWVIWVKPEEVA